MNQHDCVALAKRYKLEPKAMVLYVCPLEITVPLRCFWLRETERRAKWVGFRGSALHATTLLFYVVKFY